MTELTPTATASSTQEAQHITPATMVQNAFVPWSPPVGDSRIMFKELTSAKGKKYRIECEIPEEEDKEAWIASNSHVFDVQPISAPPDDQVRIQGRGQSGPNDYHAWADVHWQYVKDGGFKKPEQVVVDDMQITEYRLCWNSYGYYDYKLTINTDMSRSCTYRFHCEEGDYYNLDITWELWRHNVCYDSAKPNIVRIDAHSSHPLWKE